jgi:hypothetical protein
MFRAVVSGVLVGAWLMVVGAGMMPERKNTMSVKDLDDRVKEELHTGMKHTDVIAFLEAGKINHSGYVRPDNAIYVLLHNCPPGSEVKEHIQFQFWFNGKDELITYNVRELPGTDTVQEDL